MKIPGWRKDQKKRFYLVVIPVVLITLFILSLQVRSGSSSVSTYTSSRGEFVIDMEERGDLEAASQITLSVPGNARHSMRIKELVADGALVEEGELLVQFDTSDAEERVIQRQDELDNANAELVGTIARIESNMKELKNNLKNQQYSHEQAKIRFEMLTFEAESRRREGELNLKKAGLALKQAGARIESQIIIDQADLAKAEVRVKQAEMRFNEAENRLSSLTIRSPKAGFVVLHEVFNMSTRTHEKVKVGDSPHRRMPLVSIPDLSTMIVKTTINEVDIRRVETGQQASITLDALPGSVYQGVITNIGTLAHRNEGSDTKVFDVEITIDNTDERIKPGMTAQCSIITERLADQLYIPLDSVFEKEGTTIVYVKDGGFRQRVVKVGKKNKNFIIIENGLEEDEKVALRDPTLQARESGADDQPVSADM